MILFFTRHDRALALAVLGLAAFNLGFRLNREVVAEWDEALYGLSAWETTRGGHWIAITLRGTPDYYNTKPPLNIWLIALAFKAFGTSLLSLRLASAISAWLTVVVLQGWARRYFGPAVALLASLVLATSFAFMYVHSGKSANTDALFTLLMLLTVVTLCAAERQPWRLAWLGPIAGATFMLRGMAVLMPMLIVVIVEALRGRPHRERVIPYSAAALLFTAPVAAWIIARWQFDQGRFLGRLFFFDFVARTATPLDGHAGNLLYYLDILQRHHYDWLVAAAASLVLFPIPVARIRSALLTRWHAERAFVVVLSAWIAVTLIVPTLMSTKVPWYLNPFYPVFALGVAWLVVRGISQEGHRTRRRVLAGVLVVVVVVAESRLIWTSYYRRDPSRSVQGLLLAERDQLRGHRVYRDRGNNADIFVLDALIGAERGLSTDAKHFLHESRRGDYLVSTPEVQDARLTTVRADQQLALYRRNQRGHVTRNWVGSIALALMVVAPGVQTPAPDVMTYYIAAGEAGASYRPTDRQLAEWALGAWARSSGGALRFEPGDEAHARIRMYWAAADGGQYGEMRRIIVDGRPAAAVYVRPDTTALGPDISQLADRDPLMRDTIVYLTCLHELGHALGLEHTDDVRDIMYFFGHGGDIPGFFTRYRTQLRSRNDIASVAGLSPNDIVRLKALH